MQMTQTASQVLLSVIKAAFAGLTGAGHQRSPETLLVMAGGRLYRISVEAVPEGQLDPYTARASAMTGAAYEDITPEQRRRAKAQSWQDKYGRIARGR